MKKLLAIHKNEKGMTIPELLIAMSILTLTLTAAFSLLRLSETNWRMSTNRMDTRGEASRALSVIASSIRGAVENDPDEGLLNTADENEIIFYANMDADSEPERVRYYITDGDLMRDVTQPSGASQPWTYTGIPSTSTVAENLENDQDNPLFTFYDDSGNQITSLPADDDDRKTIAKTSVNIKASTANNTNTEDMSLGTSVFFRNKR